VFTGIVEELGTVRSIADLGDAARLTVVGPEVTSDARPGDSISVNGVCLTVVDLADGAFTADVMLETLTRSALGVLAPGSPVNLERAARVDSRLGGHIMQGHVDGVATVSGVSPTENWTTMTFELPAGLSRYVVEKGSIAIDGVSLTVVALDDAMFAVSLIPTTLAHTTLGSRRVGDQVNIEVDVIAKYVERLMEGRAT
jgi:riboflavin synthase